MAVLQSVLLGAVLGSIQLEAVGVGAAPGAVLRLRAVLRSVLGDVSVRAAVGAVGAVGALPLRAVLGAVLGRAVRSYTRTSREAVLLGAVLGCALGAAL